MVLLSFLCHAQQKEPIDSLLVALNGDISTTEQVNIYITLARNYGNSESVKADSFLTRATQLISKITNSDEQIEASIGIGNIYNLKGRYRAADSLFSKVIAQSEQLRFIKGQLEGHLGKAQSQYYLGKYEGALNTYDKALKINKREEDETTAIAINNGIGNILYTQGQYDNASGYYLKSLELARSVGDNHNLSRTYEKLGKNYRFQGRYQEALECYLESVKMAHELQDNDLLARLYNNLGLVHADQSQYEQAIEYYLKSIDLEDRVTDQTIALDAYFNLAGTYSDLQQFEKALVYINVVYEYDQETNYVWGQALDLNYIGTIHFRKGNYHLAIEYYLECLKLFEAIGAEGNYLDPMIRVATAYLELRQPENARQFLNRALKTADKTGLLEYKMYIYEHLSTVEEQLQNFEAAYANHILYKQLADSLADQQETKKIARLEAEFEFQQEKDSINFNFEKERINLNADIKRTTLVQRFTLAGLLLALLLILIVIRFYQLKSRSNKLLSEKNLVISEALKEKDSLMKEIHHRVKNNLQIVSSLLNIQSRFVKDDQAQKSIQDMKNRVISMSLVHQNLYNGKSVTHVYADEYLTNLAESVYKTFNDFDKPVDFKTHITRIEVGSNQAVKLGLITNEILTNAFKHAFPDGFEGKPMIRVRVDQVDSTLKLEIKDNGIGLNGSENEDSYGFKMIKSLTRSMNGVLNIQKNGTTSITLEVPLSDEV